MHYPYKVVTWDNNGQRTEHPVDTLEDALSYARQCRNWGDGDRADLANAIVSVQRERGLIDG